MARVEEYTWSVGAQRSGFSKCDAAACHAFLERLKREERLAPGELRKEAEKPRNPFHGNPMWHFGNDSAAAERWRLQLATHGIGGVRVVAVSVTDDAGDPVITPAFVQVGKRDHRGRGDAWKSFDDAMSDPLDRAEYLSRLLRAARSLEREFANVLLLYPEVAQRWRDFRASVEESIPPPTA